jgi:hypothetical protein
VRFSAAYRCSRFDTVYAEISVGTMAVTNV